MPGRGRGGGRGGPLPRPVQVSKKLSWLLRHGAEAENLTLVAGGYARVSDVLANRNLRSLKVSFAEVCEIVRDNDKQRFAMVLESEVDESGERTAPEDGDDPDNWLIRANQGHSLKSVGEEGLLVPITLDDDAASWPEIVVHGTTHKAWTLIVASGGLKVMGRNHVHFASGLPAGFKSVVDGGAARGEADGAPVVSGMRKTSTVLVFLDLKKALQAGLKFGKSANGVILSEGNEQGLVPIEVFARVEDRTGEGVLVEDGKVVKEAPASWAGKGR